jgi:hypothetical protein
VVSFTAWPLYPWEEALSIYWIVSWVSFRARLDTVEARKSFAPTGNRPIIIIIIIITDLNSSFIYMLTYILNGIYKISTRKRKKQKTKQGKLYFFRQQQLY